MVGGGRRERQRRLGAEHQAGAFEIADPPPSPKSPPGGDSPFAATPRWQYTKAAKRFDLGAWFRRLTAMFDTAGGGIELPLRWRQVLLAIAGGVSLMVSPLGAVGALFSPLVFDH